MGINFNLVSPYKTDLNTYEETGTLNTYEETGTFENKVKSTHKIENTNCGMNKYLFHS